MVENHLILRGLGLPGAVQGLTGPLLVERHDREFVDAVLGEMAVPGGMADLAATAMPTGPGSPPLRLYQPVHRVFHLALLELCCSQLGEPRLDPQRIESAGLVVRRVQAASEGPRSPEMADMRGMKLRDLAKTLVAARRELAGEQSGARLELVAPAAAIAAEGAGLLGHERLEGWMQLGKKLRGWVGFSSAQDEEQDPDPKRRRAPVRTGHPVLNALLARPETEPLAEATAPLFVAPPEVATATGKTVLYGLVPVVSTEQSEVDAAPAPPGEADMQTYLAPYLVAGGETAPIPSPTGTLSAAQVQDPNQRDASVRVFTGLLRLVSTELDAFGKSPEGAGMKAALAGLRVPFRAWKEYTDELGFYHRDPIEVYHPADEFLQEAAGLLTATGSLSVRMPLRWAQVTADQAQGLLAAAQAAVAARLQDVTPREGRFDDASRQYRLRAFVRVRRDDGCPPVTVWSEYSPPFSIRPWHEPTPAPPMQVPLPEIDMGFLKKLKPNVSFIMPPKLAAMLRCNTPEDLLGGDAATCDPELGWICGFNIPIITICAIIALYIILSLLDIVFHWMPFVKICVPLPRK